MDEYEIPTDGSDIYDSPDDSHVFAFAGLPGCGKSTAAEIVETTLLTNYEYGVHLEVSDFVRTLFKAETGDEVDDNELGRWAAEKKDEHGNGYFLRKMAETLQDEHRPHIAISGLRSPAEASALREVFGVENVTVIAIWTLPDIRFERKYGAMPSVEHDEWDTFSERNEREIYDWDCVEYFYGDDPSDYIVPNNSSVVDLEDAVTAIVHENALDGSKLAAGYRDSPLPVGDRKRVAQYL